MYKHIPMLPPRPNTEAQQQPIPAPPISEEITIRQESWTMQDGDYTGIIQDCHCYNDKNRKRKILMKIKVDNQAELFLQSFPCELFTSNPLGKAIYQYDSATKLLHTNDLVGWQIAFKVENRISNGKLYSNITEIEFIEENTQEKA